MASLSFYWKKNTNQKSQAYVLSSQADMSLVT